MDPAEVWHGHVVDVQVPLDLATPAALPDRVAIRQVVSGRVVLDIFPSVPVEETAQVHQVHGPCSSVVRPSGS